MVTMKGIKITQDKIKGCGDSLFYEDEIAHATKKNGTKLSLIACGDIKIRIDDDVYKNNQIQEAISKHKLTDRKLKKLEAEGRLEWLNNNWFEVTFLSKGAECWDSVMCDVAHDYDEAIQLLKNYIEDDSF